METKLEWVLTSMTWIFTALQDNEMWQNIQFILSITSTILVLALTIYKFIRNAASDGKIDVVAPSSVPILVMVARSGTERVLMPSPPHSIM